VERVGSATAASGKRRIALLTILASATLWLVGARRRSGQDSLGAARRLMTVDFYGASLENALHEAARKLG